MDIKNLNCIVEKDKGGILVPIEFYDLEFIPKRVFYVTNVPKMDIRGNHAHWRCRQILCCVKGMIKVGLDGGHGIINRILKEGEKIMVDRLVWDYQQFLTGNDVLLVFCEEPYDRDDYILDYKKFKKLFK